ncbi:MAG: transketolase [Deltaproteobacteria bacterium]|nr:transketolase [Deltaproteobacteria bacterium]
MRNTFVKTLCELAEHDENIFLLCGDLGFSVLEPFIEKFPSRFINVGVAEQNMTGVAAGLALSGKTVFTYSIANFPVVRCLEQIRNDVCYHNANVKIVSVGGGFTYSTQGYTHHGIEDLALMRVLPNMTVIAPGDPVETQLATEAMVKWNGPCYLRLGKAGEPIVYQDIPDFQIGKIIRVKKGTDVTFITTGGVLDLAMQAVQHLESRKISVEVLSAHTISPLDVDSILQSIIKTKKIITIEEHGEGGLASVVSEVLMQESFYVRFMPIKLDRKVQTIAASQMALRSLYGLSIENIIKVATSIL